MVGRAGRRGDGATDGRDGIEQGFEELRVVDVGGRGLHGYWHASTVDQEMELAARLATIGLLLARLAAIC